MTTIRLTMAQALVRFLDKQYYSIDEKEHKFVEGILGIFGHGNVTGLGEALEFEKHNLKFIRGHNEQGCVHIATAFAKQNDRMKIYAVTSSIGPGATNMITGAATATINRLPVLLLPGDIFSSRKPDPVLQQLEHPLSHQISVNDCFKPVSSYWDRIDRPEQLMTAMLKAMKVLTDPSRCGAVTICLPQDVQCESYDYPLKFFDKRVHYLNRSLPDKFFIEKACDLIIKSKRPVIIAGGGVHYSKASKVLQECAEKLFLPVAETQSGKSAILPDSPIFCGGVGVMGTSVANILTKKADCIIAIGTRLSDFVTCSKSIFANPSKIINININPFDSTKLEPGIELIGDAKLIIKNLFSEILSKNYKINKAYQEEIILEQEKWFLERNLIIKPDKESRGILNQAQVLGCLNNNISNNSVVVGAAGSLPGDLQRIWHVKERKGYHLEYGYSCMGYEIAGGVGVKLAKPNRDVWITCGDGSFIMMHADIITALEENLKINILLFDSAGFNSIKNLQCAYGSKGYGTDLNIPIDFCKYASSLGLKTFKALSLLELKDYIYQANLYEGSTLIEVKVKQNSQTKGYNAFWQVPISEVSNSKEVSLAYRKAKALWIQ